MSANELNTTDNTLANKVSGEDDKSDFNRTENYGRTALAKPSETRGRNQRNQINQMSTKLILQNSDNSWKSLLRDIAITFVPLFVLYKISTHPLVSNVGRPNGSQKYFPEEQLEQFLFSLSLKKKQKELQEEHRFLEAMDERKCHDFTTVDVSAKLKKRTSQPRRRNKGKRNQRGKTNNNVATKVGKMNRPMARRPTVSPSSSPLVALVASTFQANPPSVHKGTEPKTQNSNMGKPRKKKFGSRRMHQK